MAAEFKDFTGTLLGKFPWTITITDWTGDTYDLGLAEKDWHGDPLRVHFKTEAGAKDLLGANGMRFLERFVDGEVDLEGNLYLVSHIGKHADMNQVSKADLVRRMLLNRALQFQDVSRAKENVKSHYDIPQEALDVYLDRKYMSYSCGIFEDSEHLDVDELVKVGKGEGDDFDSLEKAQWRKFKDAVDFINPKEGETMLDIGCGYGGQLVVALENHPFGKVVGWTPSENQINEGRKLLSGFDKERWALIKGDYRENETVYDHITSTGMISHVGPRGLIPYVKNVRKMIKTGGRYLHHSLMTPYSGKSLDSGVGVSFNKKYVWPGFHWFTLGDHVNALQENGFEVTGSVNLSMHYAKTTAAWYERMMANRETMVRNLGEPTFRAWQIYLAGCSSSFHLRRIHVYRLYCEAV